VRAVEPADAEVHDAHRHAPAVVCRPRHRFGGQLT
jgi:hypothetical protein